MECFDNLTPQEMIGRRFYVAESFGVVEYKCKGIRIKKSGTYLDSEGRVEIPIYDCYEYRGDAVKQGKVDLKRKHQQEMENYK